ncbi:hypothetical protein ACW4TU_18470 [Streptomyces sp. QTS52]
MASQYANLSTGTAPANQAAVDLVIGTGSATLMAGTAPTVNNAAVPFADLTAAANAHNALLAALRTRGVIGGS